MKTVTEVLSEAAELLSRGHIKHRLTNGEGQYCSMGALNQALHGDADYSRDSERTPVLEALVPQLMADPEFAGRVVDTPWYLLTEAAPMIKFNNHEDTTDEDIQLVFKRAIRAAEEA